MDQAGADRIATLDLVRGVAVLGILAVNIAGFAGPPLASLTPNYPEPASALSQWTFSGTALLFEGKMRGLFSLLFGASMMLFIERAEQRGRDGALLQARRLGWLLLLGYLHATLLWPGDILFVYAAIGFAMLALRDLDDRVMIVAAMIFYFGWHLAGAAAGLLPLAPSAPEVNAMLQDQAATDLAVIRSDYAAMVWWRLANDWYGPIDMTLSSLGETAPLMAIGLAFYRTGFFTGQWRREWLHLMAIGGTAVGGLLTLAFLFWAQPRGFPAPEMLAFLLYWGAVPHLLMLLGYVAILVLAADWLGTTWLGQRLIAAGRMAFSNYIGTSLVMCSLFNGWGLGLAQKFEAWELNAFVLLGWVLMLAWSQPWLTRFRQGPLEWLWRSLTELRALPFRK